MSAKFIGIDWGSTNFRAFLLDTDAHILDRKQAARGMLSVQRDQFAAVLREQIADWLQQYPNIAIYMAGMVGARQGWVEAQYLQCPVALTQLSSSLTPVDFDAEHPCFIVPGVALKQDGDCDVMRGEETQLLGAMVDNIDQQIFCLPGTHSKWALVQAGILNRFRTYMTGELFSLLEKHSILSKQLVAEFDESSFVKGLQRAQQQRGLLADLFKVRANVLLGEQQQAESYSYLSGMLIGYELMQARDYWELAGNTTVKVIAEKTLAHWYLKGFAYLGCCAAEAVDPETAVVHGLRQIQGNMNDSQ